jgi:O-antigen/teichoic acid export membrane protein
VFSAVAADGEKLKLALRTSLQMAMFLFVPCMVGIAVVARPLINLLYGQRWEAAAPMLSVLALSGALWPVHVLNLAALSAQGRSNLFFLLAVVKSCIFIVLILLSARGGPIWIAWAVLVGSALGALVNTHYSKRHLGYGAVAQVADQSATFALSAVAAGIGWSVLHWTKASALMMFVAIAASAVTYLALAILFRSEALRGLRSAARTLW